MRCHPEAKPKDLAGAGIFLCFVFITVLTKYGKSAIDIAVMNEPLSLRKNFSWSLIASLIASGCQWGMLMVIAKLLSPTEVGYYVLGLAITAPVVLFSMLRLRAVQVTDAQNLNKFEDFLGVRLITNCAAILVVFGILVSLTENFAERW